MDTVHPRFRNFEVTLWKNRLQGGSILRENGVRNEESTRKHGCGAHAICSQFRWEGGRELGQEKGRCSLQGSMWFGGQVTAGSVPCASWAWVPTVLDLLILHTGMLVDGLYNISEEDLWSERVTVVYHRLSVRAIPTVNCQKKNITSTTQSFWYFPIFLEISDTY